jgi:hypothetical protein
MPKDRIEWPDDIQEAHLARQDRVSCLMALRNKDLDYVNKMLSEGLADRNVFNLITIIETTHPAKEHLEKWQPAFDNLLTRLSTEDYSDLLIDHVKKTLT